MVATKRVKLVYIGLFLLMLKEVCDKSNIIPDLEVLDTCFSAAVFILFILVIMQQLFSCRLLIIYGVISVIALYSAKTSGMMIVAQTVLIILAIRGENIDDIARFLFKWKCRFLLLNSIVAISFWTIGISEIGAYYEGGKRYRIHWGYGRPGHFADYILDLLVLWCWLHYENIKKQDYIKLFIIVLFTYLSTDSRVVFLVSALLPCLIWITRHTEKIDKVIQWGAKFIVPVLTFFMVFLIKAFSKNNAIAWKIDAILNTRVRLNGYYLSRYGISWLGRENLTGLGQFDPVWQSRGGTFDSAYTWLIVQMGMIWLIILTIAFFQLANRKNTLVNILLIIWALAAFIDTDFLNGIRSFSILLIVQLLNHTKRNIPLVFAKNNSHYNLQVCTWKKQ